jgi:prepilin-type N-terminal cleavage/methylation domain-containing protein
MFTRRQKGFTLVELMVVVIIIGVLASIVIANYIRMKNHANTASCISNQRNILQAAVDHSIENTIPDGDMNVQDLNTAGVVSASLCECPNEGVVDLDDYIITWLDNVPRDVTCDVKGDDHRWEPQ